MSLLEETKQLLCRNKIVPNRLLGQNFLVEETVFSRLATYASLTSNDVVLDIGAGFGFLTRFLAGKCKLVFAVEKDCQIACALGARLRGVANVQVIEGDVLTADMPLFDKVVSAPPYQISSPLLTWLFNRPFKCAVLILQKDFANRLVARVDTEDYSWLTVYSYFMGSVELLDAVPRSMFYPEPEVDSLVVRLGPKTNPQFELNNLRLFIPMLKSIFSERNKKLINAVVPFATGALKLSKEEARLRLGKLPFCKERARALKPEAFKEVANVLID